MSPIVVVDCAGRIVREQGGHVIELIEVRDGAKSDAAAEAAAVATGAVGANLLQAIVAELERVEAWSALDQYSQDGSISRIRDALTREIQRALAVVFAGEYPACVATLTGVTFGAGIAAKVKIDKAAHHRHELADATGRPVLIVLADAEEYLEDMASIRAKAKQGELFDHQCDSYPSAVAQVAAGAGPDEPAEPEMYLGDLATGEPSDDLVAALRKAGIEVSFNDTARWSAVDRAQARAWADDQNNGLEFSSIATLPAPACIAPLLASRR